MPLTPETIPLWGETLCLDYANTVSWTPEAEYVDPEATDMLGSGDMLARWGRRLGLLGDAPKSASEPELRRARALRDAVHRMFAAIGHDHDPSAEDLGLLMESYTEAINHASLLTAEFGYRLDWPAQDARRIRWAVAADAIALLRDPDRLGRVSQCPGRDCGWLFLNLSGRRRWCSMSTCGSREKMRRLHRRQTTASRLGD